MKYLAGLFAVGVIVIGITGIVAPGVLLGFSPFVATQAGLLAIAVIRVVIGVVLIWTAPASRMPRTLQIVGAIVLGAGLATPLFGVERTRAVLAWEAARPLLIRIDGAVAVAAGGFLAFALAPRPRPAVR